MDAPRNDVTIAELGRRSG